jgi:hypothetical protein
METRVEVLHDFPDFLAALRWSGVMNFLDVQQNHFPEQLQFPTSSF